MLTTATLGMAGYALYSIAAGVADLVVWSRLEIVADVALVGFGLLLLLAAAFVRAMIPGGLALALGALLALQALAIHNSGHVSGSVALAPQLMRAAVGVTLVALAFFGSRTGTRQ